MFQIERLGRNQCVDGQAERLVWQAGCIDSLSSPQSADRQPSNFDGAKDSERQQCWGNRAGACWCSIVWSTDALAWHSARNMNFDEPLAELTHTSWQSLDSCLWSHR